MDPTAALSQLFGKFALRGSADTILVGMGIECRKHGDIGGLDAGHGNPAPIQFDVRLHGKSSVVSIRTDGGKELPTTDSHGIRLASQPCPAIMESPNSQMRGGRVSLGLLHSTRKVRSNPGLLCFRRSFLRQVIVISPGVAFWHVLRRPRGFLTGVSHPIIELCTRRYDPVHDLGGFRFSRPGQRFCRSDHGDSKG